MDLMEQLALLEREGSEAIETVSGAEEVERLRVDLLGRKGRLTTILRELGTLSPEEKPRIGAEANRIKEVLSARLEARQAATSPAAATGPAIDLSLPGRTRWKGGIH